MIKQIKCQVTKFFGLDKLYSTTPKYLKFVLWLESYSIISAASVLKPQGMAQERNKKNSYEEQ